MANGGNRPAWWVFVLAALIPAALFLVALQISDLFSDSSTSFDWGGESGATSNAISGVLWLIAFIGIPAALPLAFARTLPQVGWVVAVFSALAVLSAALIIGSEDAQGAFAVFLVAIIGVPVTAVGLIAARLIRR